ncbi:metal ABC transporter substrate-binding protein [Microvirga flavescens]|uniref:metal ABC transporter substrate-binding protein n=1 Tax=Microvirga flavescens TaxID=2249811 RepID=UPI000DD5B27E|nr:metal ABC transporter substrate-binding protein [Microvirga flavescens]
MLFKRAVISSIMGLSLLAGSCFTAQAQSADKLKVVATFSILGDIVRNVGGDRIEVTTLVGPNGDAHVYAPTPADGRRLTEAKVVFANGLKFEGWISRLIKSSGTKAAVVEAAKGVKALASDDHDEGKKGHDHDHGAFDPHAWQNVANTQVYVANIRDALIAADPSAKAAYEANAADYLKRLEALDSEIKAFVAKIPAGKRRIITSHDAFRYFEAAYGIDFIAPQGVSTDAEASARDVARIIKQIKAEKIAAIFVENISDPRLMDRISKETGAKIGEPVFSDALSDASGPAGTYIDMMRHNIKAFSTALSS